MNVARLDDQRAPLYDRFLKQDPRASFFHCNAYRRLLKSFLNQEDHYLLAIHDEQIQAALPAFLHRNEELGNVLNSLPFYGSHGGVVEHEGDAQLRRRLLLEYDALARRYECAAATIISSPWETASAVYEDFARGGLRDERIGQITPLPPDPNELMPLFHSKTRNMIRKAAKSGITCVIDHSDESMQFLIDMHHENMRAIGGRGKPAAFFETLQQILSTDEYCIYTAQLEGQRVAALLLLYFHKTVEYFTPVVQAEARTWQPLSLLIHRAMSDAIGQGYRYWNWGGTWRSQEGVYRFKSRWGAEDRPYDYYTKIYDRNVLKLDADAAQRAYPYFYLYPFSSRDAALCVSA